MYQELFIGNHTKIATSLDIVGSCYEIMKEYQISLNFRLESLLMLKQLFKGNQNRPDIV